MDFPAVDGLASGTLVAVKTVTATVAHTIPDRPALRLAVGDEVAVGERDTQWPAFVFVSAAHGSGWVPARNLSRPAGSAVVQISYDTTELPTQVGDVLYVLAKDLDSGWLWCRSDNGREGWVPINTVDDIA